MASKPLDSAPSESSKASGAGSWTTAPFGYDTFLVHAGIQPDPLTGAILTPIVQATTFVQVLAAMSFPISLQCSSRIQLMNIAKRGTATAELETQQCEPSRKKLPSWRMGLALAALQRGWLLRYSCVSHPKPTSHAMQVTVMAAYLAQGDHCVMTNCSYGGTNRVARMMFQKMGIEFSFVDFTDLKEVEAAIRPNTKLIFSETSIPIEWPPTSQPN